MKKVYYDFHLHSCLSPCGDNDMTPANIAGMAFINGLNAIALTDHNTVKNCTALKNAAEQYGITVLYGMELTTDEEVHTVCLFPDEKSALEWNEYVYSKLQKIKNNPKIFGNQFFMNETDKILGEEEFLLINAANISFEDVFAPVYELGGIAYPAHVDKNANSLISNLGFVPPDSSFKLAEVHDLSKLDTLTAAHPYFGDCTILSSSDAHYLGDIQEREHALLLSEHSVPALLAWMRSRQAIQE